MIHKYADIFCWKNVCSFCSAKATHIFSAKNIRILYIESAKTVKEMTLNELVKLTTLWTTGPWSLCMFMLSYQGHLLLEYNCRYMSFFFIPSHTIVAGFKSFMLVYVCLSVHVSVSLSYVHPSVFSFLDDNLSKYQLILTKLLLWYYGDLVCNC